MPVAGWLAYVLSVDDEMVGESRAPSVAGMAMRP